MSSPTPPLPAAIPVDLLRSDIASDQDAANQSQEVLSDLEQHLSHLSIGKRSSKENPFRPLENELPRKRQKTIHLAEEDRYVESISRSARKQRQALRLQAMRREHNLRAPPYKLLEAHGNSINLSRSVSKISQENSLEGLPTELKIQILHQLPNMQSLGALIRASPLYSRAYFDIQQEIFTAHTFKELARRGVNLLPKDIESPLLLAWIDVSIIGGGPPPPDLHIALYTYYYSLITKNSKKLEISHCRALLCVSDVIGWRTWTRPVVQNENFYYYNTFALKKSPAKRVVVPQQKVLEAYNRPMKHYHSFSISVPDTIQLTGPQIIMFRRLFDLIKAGTLSYGPYPRDQPEYSSLIAANISPAQRDIAMSVRGKFLAIAHIVKP